MQQLVIFDMIQNLCHLVRRPCAALLCLFCWSRRLGNLLDVLQLLSYVAQTEREFIRKRQAEGIAAAKAKGVHFGVKPKEKPPGYQECLEQWQRGEISARTATKKLNVTHPTFLKWTHEQFSL